MLRTVGHEVVVEIDLKHRCGEGCNYFWIDFRERSILVLSPFTSAATS
jgi:RNA polymerase-interacting CarD/CdnL/TRCF family regulator